MVQDWNTLPTNVGDPDFSNLEAVLALKVPQRPTLFEFFLNGPLYDRLAPNPTQTGDTEVDAYIRTIHSFRNAGYDYATVGVPGFGFAAAEVEQKQTRSINDGAVICDRDSYDAYAWPNPDDADYAMLDKLAVHLPTGMKFVVNGPGGVLENAIRLVGYEALCFIIIDNDSLAAEIFDAIGSRLVRYYDLAASHESVGAIIGNDDWGFKSQTMLSPADMRQFVFPWHEQLVAAAHAHGRPAILHSCGCLRSVMDDVIDGMKYDGKHSYEDTIQPVEEAYEEYGSRIAILGGIDLDYICRSSPDDVHARSAAMLERAMGRGAYALGTGNSVPEYVPDEGYFAMINAAHIGRGPAGH